MQKIANSWVRIFCFPENNHRKYRKKVHPPTTSGQLFLVKKIDIYYEINAVRSASEQLILIKLITNGKKRSTKKKHVFWLMGEKMLIYKTYNNFLRKHHSPAKRSTSPRQRQKRNNIWCFKDTDTSFSTRKYNEWVLKYRRSDVMKEWIQYFCLEIWFEHILLYI